MAVLSIITLNWRQSKWPSTVERMNQMWYITHMYIITRVKWLITQCNIIQSLKKEWATDMGYNTDEPQKHHGKWNKPDTKDRRSYDSI